MSVFDDNFESDETEDQEMDEFETTDDEFGGEPDESIPEEKFSDLEQKIEGIENSLKSREQLDPLILQAVLGQQQQQPTDKITEPEHPVPPVKPENFNRAEALADPNSASGQYVAAYQAYLEKLGAWQEYQIQKQTNTIEQLNANLQQLQSTAMKNAQLTNIQRELQVKHGMSAADVTDFLTFADNPENITLENLLAMYKAIKGQSMARPAQMNRNNINNLGQLPPAGGMPNQTESISPKDMEKSFLNSLVNFSKGEGL